ncbi:MAG: dihydrofolate reductase [Legionella sp.]|nr:MAG: dihydrofolate reductase [Legionella sp.]
MSLISLIAAMDMANGIGKNNQLLCHLPADLQYFKANTINKPIIMGRHTFESIGKPLPQRINIVVSTTMSPRDDLTVVNSVEKAIEITQEYQEVMIIGGEKLYNSCIFLADRLYLTFIHHLFDADVFFPQVDENQWHCQKSEFRQHDEKNKYDMTFKIFSRV